jgi:myo-inositol 2-dehydrogenase/D-chiro-inositol 1-dehydrogenase
MINFAVFGCGRIGRTHARGIARNPRATLISVYDPLDTVADATAGEFGAKRATSVDTVLADPRVDAVLIATPTATHVGLIVAAARAGKAVFCEKPIDLDMERVLECHRIVNSFTAPIMIGFNRRFDPSFRAIRQRIQAGEIGRVEQVVITSRDPQAPPASYVAGSGGMFRDMTIHDFDMARFIAGDIAELHAFGANLIDPAIGAAGDIDAGMITLRATSGALVHINNSRRCAYGYDQRLEVFGANGMLVAGNRHATTVEASTVSGTGLHDPVLPFFIERYAEAYLAEIDHFIDCLTARTDPAPGFADGIEALRLADAAVESARTGRTVRLPG